MKYIKKAGMASFLVLSILALPFMADQAEATTVNVIQYGAQADDNQLDTRLSKKPSILFLKLAELSIFQPGRLILPFTLLAMALS
ncbi:hypothetical protein [Domibacillus sp.]|uniref:hypothetical protein n=1 Tax=Domibacillus sp. TaxID=1969783 RepID=UPI0028120FF5|nr:hypothetical protein [Domibacillus sp.]